MSGPIIVIDDEPMICRVSSLSLRGLGREVLTFTDPLKALAWLADAPEAPCVVVCDYRMPGLTGLEVLERLPQSVPFVLMSGDLFDVDGDDARIAAFLAKPLQPSELMDAVMPFVVR
ncbi:MAG: response regulator [Myxococcaceae bacterium]|nr:response regulator [Myxococcaceae bacterium]